MQDNLTFISVIVPTHNSRGYLSQSLSAIRRSDYPCFELIVVDDASSDGSAEIAKSYADTIITLENKTGPAKARNIGAKQSKGEILFFVDADVKVAADTVSKVATAMCDEPEIAAIFGSYDTHPSSPGFFSQYKNLFHHFVHQNSNPLASTFWSGCGAIRKEIFIKTGGFPEDYSFAAVEDVELGHRIALSTMKIKLVKQIQVTHLKKWDCISLIKTDVLYRAIPWTKFAFKKRELPYNLNFKLADRISGAGSLFLFLTFILMWRWKFLVFVVIALTGALLYLNRELYKFFYKTKGLAFTIGGILFHWFYFFYSSAVFACVSLFLCVSGWKKQNQGQFS